MAPEHFDEWWGYGTFFVVAAAGECALVAPARAATTLVGHPGRHLDQPRDDADVPREPHLRHPVRAGHGRRRDGRPAWPRRDCWPRAPSSWCSAGCSRDGSGAYTLNALGVVGVVLWAGSAGGRAGAAGAAGRTCAHDATVALHEQTAGACRSFRTVCATDRGRPVTAEPRIGSRRSRAVPLAAVALLLLVLAFALKTWVAEPFAIPSESMAPTLRPGDHVLVEKLSYRFGSPRRGDLVVFRSPDGARSPSSASSVWPAIAWRSRTASSRQRTPPEGGLVDQARSTPSTSGRSSCRAATSSCWATTGRTPTTRATTGQCLAVADRPRAGHALARSSAEGVYERASPPSNEPLQKELVGGGGREHARQRHDLEVAALQRAQDRRAARATSPAGRLRRRA